MELGQVFGGGGKDLPRAGSYAARFDLRKRVVSPRLHRPTTRVRRRKKKRFHFIYPATYSCPAITRDDVRQRARNSSERNFPLGLGHSSTHGDPRALDCQVQKILAAFRALPAPIDGSIFAYSV